MPPLLSENKSFKIILTDTFAFICDLNKIRGGGWDWLCMKHVVCCFRSFKTCLIVPLSHFLSVHLLLSVFSVHEYLIYNFITLTEQAVCNSNPVYFK